MLSLKTSWLTLASAVAGLANVVSHAYVDYDLCQYPTPDPLRGCPPNTIVVGGNSTFTTIQSAIKSLPEDSSAHHILVLAGNYTEKLNVTRGGPLTIFGVTSSPRSQPANLVNVIWASANAAGAGLTDNAYTSVLTVAPTLNASLVGSGPNGFNVSTDTPFGSIDFRVYNVNFRNVFAEQTAGPSHALGVSRANAGFYFSGFYSYQDSVYTGHLGNSYFYGCELAGQTDFLYGFGTAWVESSVVSMRGCGGGIIAWKGTNTTFSNKYGCYISNSTVTASNATIAANNVGRCSLGRPWNSQHRSIYMNSYMDTTVNFQGYTNWGTTFNNYTLMAEYETYGPGWNETARIIGNITKILDPEEVVPYSSPQRVFMTPKGVQPNFQWIDKRFLKT